jgi:hypothetical protein
MAGMSNRRPLLIAVIAGAVVLCLCLACGVSATYYYYTAILPNAGITGEFAGHYISGFEVSSFVPCGNYEIGNASGAWWLGATPEAGFYDQYQDVIGPDAGEYVTVFVVWRGTVSGPGQYGHLGGYIREATVEEVIEMSLDGTC